MSTRRPILFPAICLALAVFCAATAQPLQPEGDNEFGGTPGMHLFLQSRFIRTHQADRLHFARMRHYREGYLDAVGHGEYARALAFSDSLIRTAEHHPVAGVHFTDCYKERADMFRRLHRDSEACMAYARAVKVRDSLLRLEQSKVIREKQESYELDRMALDAALLTAHHHKTALAYVSLALLVIAAVVGAIYVGNRRTRRLQKELLLQTKHAHESELKKAAFVNSVCHEVRTPLNCIMGFSELLCAEEITPESRAQYCEIIRDNRRQLRFLFDDMLEVAYLENLHAPLPCQYTNLCAVCQAQLRIMKVRYPKPGIVYKGAIPVAEIALNTSDKYLTILISALLGNAYKFTQEGTISLECDRLGDDRVFVAGLRHPAREARLCLRAFHQTRPLQPGQRPRALPLPPDRHPPARGDIHRLRIHGRDAHRRHPAAQVTPPASAAPHPLPGRAGHPSPARRVFSAGFQRPHRSAGSPAL